MKTEKSKRSNIPNQEFRETIREKIVKKKKKKQEYKTCILEGNEFLGWKYKDPIQLMKRFTSRT